MGPGTGTNIKRNYIHAQVSKRAAGPGRPTPIFNVNPRKHIPDIHIWKTFYNLTQETVLLNKIDHEIIKKHF